MINQLSLIGRLVGEVEVKELENGGKVANLTLAVPRSYKNENGIYETDFIDCKAWYNIATNIAEYCRKGDLIGVKGRLQTRTIEKDDIKTKITEVIVEKVSFLSSKRNDEV